MENGIRIAEKRDIPAMREIWKVCFHDSDAYVRFFYREGFDGLEAAVYAVNDVPVSMLHWMDCRFVNGDEQRDAKFLYAGGTLPEYRKNGYYGTLFSYITSLADQNGFAVFGKPASRELVPYYQQFGLEPDACLRRVTVAPDERIELAFSPLTPEAYNRMRSRAFADRPHAEWPDRHVEFCMKENAFFGVRTLAVEMDGETRFVMGAPSAQTLVITETDLTLPQLRRAGGALCDLFGTGLIKAYLPEHTREEGEEIISSIVYNAPLSKTYVNLILI